MVLSLSSLGLQDYLELLVIPLAFLVPVGFYLWSDALDNFITSVPGFFSNYYVPNSDGEESFSW